MTEPREAAHEIAGTAETAIDTARQQGQAEGAAAANKERTNEERWNALQQKVDTHSHEDRAPADHTHDDSHILGVLERHESQLTQPRQAAQTPVEPRTDAVADVGTARNTEPPDTTAEGRSEREETPENPGFLFKRWGR